MLASGVGLPPTDAVGVTNTLNDFMLALDQGDAARFADLFAPDGGSCEVVRLEYTARTRADLEGLCADLHRRFAGTLHFELNHVIRQQAIPPASQPIDPAAGQTSRQACTNRSYWQAVRDGETVSSGIHVDDLERDPATGLWLFRRRRIWHVWTKGAGAERDRWHGVDLGGGNDAPANAGATAS
jgi:hypothetical protein